MIVDVPMPGASNQRHIGIPVKMGSTPGTIRSGAPHIGQDTAEVLTELGFDRAAIDHLEQSGAIAIGDDS